MNAKDLASFEKLLLKRKALILNDVNHLENNSLHKSRRKSTGDISSVPFHVADRAGDDYEQEFTLGLIQNEGEELREIEASLTRIREKTFGKCEVCEKEIPKARLRAIPYAKLCIRCQRKQEEEGYQSGADS